MKLQRVRKANDGVHKYIATFMQDDGRSKKVRFGALGYKDYTSFPAEIREERRTLYLKRHKAREEWTIPDTPGALSRWILWEHTSLRTAIREFKKRFNL
jgi:hypothetical protein